MIKQNAVWAETARELFKAKEMKKQYEKVIEKLEVQLIALSDNNPSYAGGFKFEPIERKGNVDYSVVPELIGVNLEQYRKASSIYWKLSACLTQALDELGV